MWLPEDYSIEIKKLKDKRDISKDVRNTVVHQRWEEIKDSCEA